MNKKRLFALIVMPILSLISAVTLADVAAIPNASANGITPVPGEIKNAKPCGDATFYKNAFPSLTNGTPGGSTTIEFLVEGKTIPMTVTWGTDNSFGFELDGGWASKVGVTVDTNNFIYDYTGRTADGVADTQLNYYGGLTADDVNHLDLCLNTLDSDAPGVDIRVEPSEDGTTVSGTVSIIATVIDESPVFPTDLTITIVRVDDLTDVTPVFPDPTPSDCDPAQAGCQEFTWTWDTSPFPPGEYIITIGATDTSVLKNAGSDSITVTVSVKNCLEGDDGITGGVGGIQGCNPSGFQWVELPEELRNSGLLDGETLTQAAVPAKFDKQTLECGGAIVDAQTGEREFPFVAHDPRWNNGVYTAAPLDLSEVFDLSLFVSDPAGKAVMRADTRGEPCLAMIYGEASFSFADFYNPIDYSSLFGAYRYTYAITQLPETPELGLNLPDDVGPLGPDQIDLQKVPEATYQPTDRFLETFVGNELGPFTKEVFNPQRAKTPDFSYYVLGTVQVCESLLGSALTGLPYYEAVLQCSTDLAVEYFDDLDLLLAYVGEPSLPSYPEACLVSPSAENLRVELNKARSMIKVGDWTKATTRLNDLLTDVLQGVWRVDDRNCPGHVVMRLENLLWRTAQLEYAESLLPPP